MISLLFHYLQVVQQRSCDWVSSQPIQTGVCFKIQSYQRTEGKWMFLLCEVVDSCTICLNGVCNCVSRIASTPCTINSEPFAFFCYNFSKHKSVIIKFISRYSICNLLACMWYSRVQFSWFSAIQLQLHYGKVNMLMFIHSFIYDKIRVTLSQWNRFRVT